MDITNIKDLTIGIVDEPNPKGSSDKLNIYRHSGALTKFIKSTSTPMTIGIQGEWGSGKTSLLNSIYHSLEKNEIYKQIWVNTWEHSILTTPAEALLKIVNEIIQEMLSSDSKIKNSEKIKNVASNVFKGALRIGATTLGGSEAGAVTKELLGESSNSIKELRQSLHSLAEDLSASSNNQYEKIIIYVDDLDRIEPKEAVQVLELLKNIFSIPNCVFILAIDYQVVVKGLEHKFGKRTDENEWEFRAFFDKIIQLPFMMPMSQYSIGKYVSDLLKKIGFIENNGQYEQEIEQIISYTIGGNPRSLKRLVNSISLINIFSEIDEDNEVISSSIINKDDSKDILLFSLICLQISFPKIYDLLIEYPDFTKWNDDTAFKVTQKKEEKEKDKFEEEFKIVSTTENFDEQWEKALFRICYPSPRYRSRVIDISKFFNYLKSNILLSYIEKGELGNFIAEVIDITAVTSVSSTDDSQAKSTKLFQKIVFDDLSGLVNNLKEKNKISDKTEEILKYLYKYLSENSSEDVEFKFTPSYISVKTNGRVCLAIKSTKSSINIDHPMSKGGIDYLGSYNLEIKPVSGTSHYSVRFPELADFQKCEIAVTEYLNNN